MISVPFGVTPSPKEEMYGKLLANKTFKFVDHETNFFAINREMKHPSRKMNNIEIFGIATNGCLQEKSNGVLIEADGRAPKTHNQEKCRCS